MKKQETSTFLHQAQQQFLIKSLQRKSQSEKPDIVIFLQDCLASQQIKGTILLFERYYYSDEFKKIENLAVLSCVTITNFIYFVFLVSYFNLTFLMIGAVSLYFYSMECLYKRRTTVQHLQR